MHLSDDFFKAASDYRYLLNRKYPPKPSLKLTADRYRLSGTERTILFRGIFSESEAEARKAKKVQCINGETLHIDLINVLVTLTNYHLGRFMFIGMDGFLRDDGENYPAGFDSALWHKCLGMLSAFINDRGILCRLYSTRDIVEIYDYFGGHTAEIVHCRIPDDELTEINSGIICTADGETINRTQVNVYDISYTILHTGYHPVFLNLAVS